MKKFLTTLVFCFFLFNIQASRSLYVDGFGTILGDTAAENTLLRYAEANDFETLLLYKLHIVNTNYTLTNTSTNFVLADFIKKAKTQFNIEKIGAVGESPDFFKNVINTYNNSRSEPEEKFDIYNLEFEYWINSTIEPGGYYCTTYLTPNGYPCHENGAFQYYISILDTMNTLVSNNTHPISTEAYIGWPSAGQADTIGQKVDKLLLHAYVQDPNTAFSYSENRLIDLANGNPNLKVSIIFSAEQVFMQDWLETNTISEAEDIFYNDWDSVSSSWTNNIDLQEFTYFTYSKMSNIKEPIIEELNNIQSAFNQESTFILNNNVIYLESHKHIKSATIYDINGQKIETFENEINLKININDLNSGIYFLKVKIDSEHRNYKFIKYK